MLSRFFYIYISNINNMKSKLLTLIIFFTTQLIICQNPIGTGSLSDGYKIMRNNSLTTPFLTSDWNIGYGIDLNGIATKPLILNYDIHGNNLVYKNSNNSETLKLVDSNLAGFIINIDSTNKIFKKIEGHKFDRKKRESKYYQIPFVELNSIIIEYSKTLEDPYHSRWSSSTNNSSSSEYKETVKYYILNKKDKFVEISLNNRSVKKALKNRSDALETYLKNNKISSLDELKTLMLFYNSI